MADLETIQKKILSAPPIEIPIRSLGEQMVPIADNIVSLPIRKRPLNLTRGERNERDWAQFHDPLPR